MDDSQKTRTEPGTDDDADDERISSDDETLDDRDKELADSFPASDPPAMP